MRPTLSSRVCDHARVDRVVLNLARLALALGQEALTTRARGEGGRLLASYLASQLRGVVCSGVCTT